MAPPLKVGQILQVMVYTGDRTVPCEAMVLEVEEASLTICPPHRHNVKIPINADHLVVTLTTTDAAYMMDCPIQQELSEGLLLGIPPDSDIQKVQRRQFARIPAVFACTFTLENRSEPPIAGLMIDLSGGGCSFSSPNAIARGQRLVLSFKLPEEGSFKLRGVVRRSNATMTNGRVQHSIGFEFDELEEVNRKRLVRFVYNVQLDLFRANK